MALDQRELSISSQNAGNVAATLLAAMIARTTEPPGVDKVIEMFDKLRAHVLAGTIAASELTLSPGWQTNTVPAPPVGHQNAAYVWPPPQNAAPEQQTGPIPTCNHGPRVYKTGTSSKGPWCAWMCPLPQEQKAQRCDAVFL